MKKNILRSILLILAIALIGLGFYIADLISFPGNIKNTVYDKQITTSGVKSAFQKGVIYRYPNIVPMLEVTGGYYEMGLQYGVLLRPEIVKSIASQTKILKWVANDEGVPYLAMIALFKFKARKMAESLPQKYQDEMRGVADGSGLPYDTVIMAGLFYDIGMGMDCTGVLMRGKNGSIIQGRNNDTAGSGGEELAKMNIVVRHKANGFNVVTHMDPLLYMGVETGYNDKGLSFGEETLRIKKPNPDGYSLPYLIRMIMEEASSLDEIYPYFDKYHTIAAYGCVWGDLRAGKGAVVELTPTAWAKNEFNGPLLWNFNRIYDAKLADQQKPSRNIAGLNIDRETIAAAFPRKQEYTVTDAVNFVREQVGPDGTDYSWSGTKFPVCNWMASQMMVFDTNTDGFYMAVGPYYAARQNVYHFYDDFSKQPKLFMPAIPIEPVIEKAAQIENRLISKTDKLGAFIDLAGQYKNDANAQFIVAYKSFKLSKLDTFADYAIKAYTLKPNNSEYQIYAGMAHYQKKDMEKAASLLSGVTGRYPELEIYRLTILEKVCSLKDLQKSSKYKEQKEAILKKHSAETYYDKYMTPLFDALNKVK